MARLLASIVLIMALFAGRAEAAEAPPAPVDPWAEVAPPLPSDTLARIRTNRTMTLTGLVLSPAALVVAYAGILGALEDRPWGMAVAQGGVLVGMAAPALIYAPAFQSLRLVPGSRGERFRWMGSVATASHAVCLLGTVAVIGAINSPTDEMIVLAVLGGMAAYVGYFATMGFATPFAIIAHNKTQQHAEARGLEVSLVPLPLRDGAGMGLAARF